MEDNLCLLYDMTKAFACLSHKKLEYSLSLKYLANR